jgi:hypothetical protein
MMATFHSPDPIGMSAANDGKGANLALRPRATRFKSDLPAAGRKIALPRHQVFDLPHSARSHSAARPILDGAAAAIEL